MNELWQRIERFDIDGEPVALTFPRRLARENGWTVSFATRVVAEYKRYVYLAMTAGHPVTPSEHVDQAWHLHLTYTRSYWERLNGAILPVPLHHHPTRGGSSEDARFDDWYRRTLASYERVFGTAPPADIWPAAERRFGHDLAWRRVNTRDHWVVPKAAAAAVGLATLAITVGGCSAGPELIPVVGVVVLILAVIVNGLAMSGRRRRNGGDGGGCTAGSAGCGGSFLGSGDSSSGGGDGDGGGCGGGGCGGGGCGGGGCGS
jgi:hypothetical protein